MTTQTEVETPASVQFSPFTWVLLILALLILLLAAGNAVLLAMSALNDPTIKQPSGGLLYATTFDGYPQEWSQYEGQMSSRVADGALHITINAEHDGAFSVLNYDFADFDLRANAVRISAQDDYNEIGLLFRYRDANNYYIFKIRGDGYYRVERRKDGQTDVLSEWHASPAVLQGLNVVNRLQVIGQGNTFKFLVNDQPLILCPNGPDKQKSTWNAEQCLSNGKQTSQTLKDDTFRTGKIGVGVRVDTAGIEVAFDNVLVYAP